VTGNYLSNDLNENRQIVSYDGERYHLDDVLSDKASDYITRTGRGKDSCAGEEGRISRCPGGGQYTRLATPALYPDRPGHHPGALHSSLEPPAR
jgi:hypothetical protein